MFKNIPPISKSVFVLRQMLMKGTIAFKLWIVLNFVAQFIIRKFVKQFFQIMPISSALTI